MTLTEFKNLLLTADPLSSHYESNGKTNYTVWSEYGANRLTADNTEVGRTWEIQVDRFTKIEFDPIADAIAATLNNAEIAFTYLLDYEPDTKYIHHIWDCEVD